MLFDCLGKFSISDEASQKDPRVFLKKTRFPLVSSRAKTQVSLWGEHYITLIVLLFDKSSALGDRLLMTVCLYSSADSSVS